MSEIKKKSTGRKPVHLVAAQKKPGGRDGIWAEIRKQREFTYRSLTDTTDIPKKTISDYLKGLEAAGVIKSEQEAGTAESRTGKATTEQYHRHLRALMPQGRPWRTEEGASLSQLLAGFAGGLNRNYNRAVDLIDEAEPRTTVELLTDWERVCGLPDGCTASSDATLIERRHGVNSPNFLVARV